MTTERSVLTTLMAACVEALTNLEGYTTDSTDVVMLLEAKPDVVMLAEVVKIVAGGIDASLRAAITRADGAVFLPDGRTMSIGKGDPVRTIRSDTNRLIDARIARRALTEAEGEAAPAIDAAIRMTRELYVAATALPKWTPLKALGFTTWDDVLDVDTKPGKVEVQ